MFQRFHGPHAEDSYDEPTADSRKRRRKTVSSDDLLYNITPETSGIAEKAQKIDSSSTVDQNGRHVRFASIPLVYEYEQTILSSSSPVNVIESGSGACSDDERYDDEEEVAELSPAPGYPRATRLMKWLVVGAVIASVICASGGFALPFLGGYVASCGGGLAALGILSAAIAVVGYAAQSVLGSMRYPSASTVSFSRNSSYRTMHDGLGGGLHPSAVAPEKTCSAEHTCTADVSGCHGVAPKPSEVSQDRPGNRL